MEELLKQMEAQAKKDVALLLKNQVALAFDKAVEAGANEIKAKIPGNIDDAILALVVPVITPVIKEELLKLISKIEA